MTPLTVTTTIDAPISKVWECWNEPQHITQWAFATDGWYAPKAENDLIVGGTFTTVMAAKDGSAQFDFSGTYTVVKPQEKIEYDMSDGRHVAIEFVKTENGVEVTETFDPENENDLKMQQDGWQAILDNFKSYVEKKA